MTYQVRFGIGSLEQASNPSDQLYEGIIKSLEAGLAPWTLGATIKATKLAAETKLARGTVTRTLLRLVTEGILEPQQGKGYRINDVSARPRQTMSTLVSVSEFAEHEGLECISVLDTETCHVQPLHNLARRVPSGSDFTPELMRELQSALGIMNEDPVLLIRRARGFREKGSSESIKWAILETLILVERKLPHLGQYIRRELQAAGAVNPMGNVSLHRWIKSQGIELERSEYTLSLAGLRARDAKVWERIRPRPHHRAAKQFIRLQAVTYGKGRGPLLHTVEHLVPDMFKLGVSGFQFQRGSGLH